MTWTIAPLSMTIDQARIAAYAEVTEDFNPIHLDPAFAERTPMGGVIAHGTMAVNLIWLALEASLGRQVLAGMTMDVRFRRPVRVGDTIEAGATYDPEQSSFKVFVRNQDGIDVIEGTAMPADFAWATERERCKANDA